MALTIPEHELSQCMEFTRSANAALGLTNDLFSWDKERLASEQAGRSYVVNAIWVLMHERSLTESEAKSVCREKIKEYVADYLQVVERVKGDPALSSDVRCYVEALQYSISGNLVWSLSCPRYQKITC